MSRGLLILLLLPAFLAGCTESGEEVSAKSAKLKIKEIIAKEDAKKPLSDQKIADMLREDELIIARRTVAKYREQLGILPARHRKQY